MYVCTWLGVYVKFTMKIPGQNDFKLGIVVVVFDTVSRPINFGFKKSRVT